MPMNIGILGAGTWGTALAALLARNNHKVTLWSAVGTEIDSLVNEGVHKNLKGTVLPKEIIYTKSEEEVAKGKDMLLFVVASEYMRPTAKRVAKYVEDGCILASATKGIESGTLKTMSEIIDDEMKASGREVVYSLAAISGPTHAEEVAVGLPTSCVAASTDESIAFKIAEAFSNTCMRVYTNTDIVGVEIAGALKNIIAIAAGINRGMGFGDNSQAMLITRGIAEMNRMGQALGCRRRTFMGLAGVGDLIVTCTSMHSRNNRCGILIGQGYTYAEAAEQIGMVVEGYYALEAAMQLSEKYGVELPITEAVYSVIMRGMAPREAMLSLMTRELKSELE